MNPSIFREYDIRGVAEHDMPDAFVKDLGRAVGTFLKRKGAAKIVLGRDCRMSSPRLHTALRDGLLETGIHLLDIGVGPTPLMYFSVFHFNLDGGVQITGSHNPPNDNGFKLMSGKSTLYGKDIQTLREMIEKQDFELPAKGGLEEVDAIPAYAGYMKGNFDIKGKRIRFAIDAGNGAGGPTALAAMHAVGLEPDPMFCSMDGAFPNHHPDPSMPENLEALITRVKSQHYDLGIAFDGDADRIGVIDANGEIIWGDKLLILLSRALLKTHPGATIISEVKASQTLYDDIAKHGGRGILWKTGHSLIKKKMKEEKALLAGEMSGHVFYADRYFGFDDAIYTALRLVEILSREDKALHELIADVPVTYATPEIRVDCPDDQKFDVVERVKAHYKGKKEVIDIDGVRILFEQGWGLVRASNTQPVLVLRFEAATKEALSAIRNEVESVVKQARN
ncbi:MAG: phosphomannomutase/phosphoglucomutase [Myxococcales bacterium]|nr:MAG: phosphomannomutase/phosphoglucomutase [Myxococcales bacterium]